MLLGSIASPKYVDVLLGIFGERLRFPAEFVGRGDMSRGGLLLRQAAEGAELDYVPVSGAVRRGARPPKLPPLRARASHSPPGRTPREHTRRPARHPARVDGRRGVRLTNLRKIFWPELGSPKAICCSTTRTMADVLLPHVRDRAMVMKRYPHGAAGEFFFMKRAPTPRPPWIETCSIAHGSGNVIDFPMIQDRASLLWVINLGCIDLNQWYARCDDVDRPDYLHFDLDPGPGRRVRSRARGRARRARGARRAEDAVAREDDRLEGPARLCADRARPWAEGCVDVREGAGAGTGSRHPALLTAEYRVAKRPRGRVLVDYNQNAWGRTLASVYSVRPRPEATVSTPVTWKEIERGVRIEDFTMKNVPKRVARLGDLWKPL